MKFLCAHKFLRFQYKFQMSGSRYIFHQHMASTYMHDLLAKRLNKVRSDAGMAQAWAHNSVFESEAHFNFFSRW